ERQRRIAELVADGAPAWKLNPEINRWRGPLRCLDVAAGGMRSPPTDGAPGYDRPSHSFAILALAAAAWGSPVRRRFGGGEMASREGPGSARRCGDDPAQAGGHTALACGSTRMKRCGLGRAVDRHGRKAVKRSVVIHRMVMTVVAAACLSLASCASP